MKPYILDDASTSEYQRLDLMSKILDPWTRGYLGALGVGQGWQCLELGGGNGSIAEWLCCHGRPLGERDGRRHQPGAARVGPRPEPHGAADGCTHGRIAGERLRSGHLPRLAAPDLRVRPGGARADGRRRQAGWMAVGPGARLPPRADHGAGGLGKTWKALIEWGHANGVDWLIGRGLPGMVGKLGLGQPQAKTDVQNIRGRDRGALYFQLFFAEVRDRVIGSGQLDAATLDAASALLDDPDYWTQCWMMTAVWARKPLA